jgi:hypothetical protein
LENHKPQTTLSEGEAERLRHMFKATPYRDIAKTASLSGEALLAAACQVECRRSTIALIRQSLDLSEGHRQVSLREVKGNG